MVEGSAKSEPSLERETLEDLVLAMLTVNSWGLEKAFSIRAGLAREGLFDVHALASLSEDELVRRLDAAGYRRGSFMQGTIARRLKTVAVAWVGGLKSQLLQASRRRDVGVIRGLLLPLHGMGEATVTQFLILREIEVRGS